MPAASNALPPDIDERCAQLRDRLFQMDSSLPALARGLKDDCLSRGILLEEFLSAFPHPERQIVESVLSQKPPPSTQQKRKHKRQQRNIDLICSRCGISRDEFENYFFGASSYCFFASLEVYTRDCHDWPTYWTALYNAREQRVREVLPRPRKGKLPLWTPSDIYTAAKTLGRDINFPRNTRPATKHSPFRGLESGDSETESTDPGSPGSRSSGTLARSPVLNSTHYNDDTSDDYDFDPLPVFNKTSDDKRVLCHRNSLPGAPGPSKRQRTLGQGRGENQPPASTLGLGIVGPSSIACLKSPTGCLTSDIVDRALEFCCLRPDASIISLSSLLPGSNPQNHPELAASFARLVQLPARREILLPLNINSNHWVLAHIQLPTLSTDIYNSLPPSTLHGNAVKSLLEQFFSRFAPEEDISKLKITNYPGPLQQDTFNCGIFVIGTAFYLASRTPFLTKEPFHPQIWRDALIRLLSTGTDRLILWPFSAIDDANLTSVNIPPLFDERTIAQGTVALSVFSAHRRSFIDSSKLVLQATIDNIKTGIKDRRHALAQLRVLSSVVDYARQLVTTKLADWRRHEETLIDEELSAAESVSKTLEKFSGLRGSIVDSRDAISGRCEQLRIDKNALVSERERVRKSANVMVERLGNISEATDIGRNSINMLEKELAKAVEELPSVS